MGDDVKGNFTSEEKIQIMQFICAFAWADFKVVAEERAMINRLSANLKLNEHELSEVKAMLTHPPHPDDIDPLSIPEHLKEYILSAVQAISIVDGDFDEKEAELLDIFTAVLNPPK